MSTKQSLNWRDSISLLEETNESFVQGAAEVPANKHASLYITTNTLETYKEIAKGLRVTSLYAHTLATRLGMLENKVEKFSSQNFATLSELALHIRDCAPLIASIKSKLEQLSGRDGNTSPASDDITYHCTIDWGHGSEPLQKSLEKNYSANESLKQCYIWKKKECNCTGRCQFADHPRMKALWWSKT